MRLTSVLTLLAVTFVGIVGAAPIPEPAPVPELDKKQYGSYSPYGSYGKYGEYGEYGESAMEDITERQCIDVENQGRMPLTAHTSVTLLPNQNLRSRRDMETVTSMVGE